MTDRELRELCNRFFDALENQDLAAIADLYHPDMRFWINLTGEEKTREQNLATLEAGYALNRRRTYDDRVIDTFPNGFVVQFSCNVVRHDGTKNSLSNALVVLCKDGKIGRMDEYLDSGKFSPPSTAA